LLGSAHCYRMWPVHELISRFVWGTVTSPFFPPCLTMPAQDSPVEVKAGVSRDLDSLSLVCVYLHSSSNFPLYLRLLAKLSPVTKCLNL